MTVILSNTAASDVLAKMVGANRPLGVVIMCTKGLSIIFSGYEMVQPRACLFNHEFHHLIVLRTTCIHKLHVVCIIIHNTADNAGLANK